MNLSDGLYTPPEDPIPAALPALPPPAAPQMNLLQMLLQWLQMQGGKNLTGKGRSFSDYTPSDR